MDDGEGTSAAGQGGENEDLTPEEPIWTFRGVRLGPAEFTTSMVHLFRAEIARANAWRQRLDTTTNWAVIITVLDTTTNWAVIITVAVITVSFSESGSHHGAIALSTVLLALFLYIEARRYRYYELWSYRVRLMETDFFAAMLVPPFHPDPDWAESLAENLLQPEFSVSIWEALGRRCSDATTCGSSWSWRWPGLPGSGSSRRWPGPGANSSIAPLLDRCPARW